MLLSDRERGDHRTEQAHVDGQGLFPKDVVVVPSPGTSQLRVPRPVQRIFLNGGAGSFVFDEATRTELLQLGGYRQVAIIGVGGVLDFQLVQNIGERPVCGLCCKSDVGVAGTGAAVIAVLAIAIAIGFEAPLMLFVRWGAFIALVFMPVCIVDSELWWVGFIGGFLLAVAVEATVRRCTPMRFKLASKKRCRDRHRSS